MPDTWPEPEFFLADRRVVIALVGEAAANAARKQYDLDHGLWTPPLWNRRAHKRAANKASRAARREWIAVHAS